MMQPKKTKYRKAHKGRIHGLAKGGTVLNFGAYGLKATSPGRVRQGKGKGTPEWWAARVKPGRIMFELDGVSREIAEEAFVLASAKLPIHTRFVMRLGEEG
jgi:large subunit ribosomal protein L16